MSVEAETLSPVEGKASPSTTSAPVLSDAATTILLLYLKWRLIAKFAAAGMLLGLVLAFVLPKKYKSTAELMPPDNFNSRLSALSAFSGLTSSVAGSGISGDLVGVKPSDDLFIGILQSETVQDNLINKFNLLKVYRDKYYVNARKELARNTEISADPKSGIISITVIDKDPKRAAAMARQYINELDHLVVTLDTSSAHRERVFLDGRLKIVRQNLDSAEAALGQFSSKNATLDLTNQGRATLDAVGRIQGQLIAARAQLDGLQEIYGPQNARVKSGQAQVAELQHELQMLGGSSTSKVTGTLSGTALFPSLRQLPLVGITYAELYRRATLEAALYETLTKQYELARVQEAKELPAVKVLDPPLVPERKFSPPRAAILLLAIMLSAAFGIIWVLGKNRWAEQPADSSWKVLFDSLKARRAKGVADVSKVQALLQAARRGPNG